MWGYKRKPFSNLYAFVSCRVVFLASMRFCLAVFGSAVRAAADRPTPTTFTPLWPLVVTSSGPFVLCLAASWRPPNLRLPSPGTIFVAWSANSNSTPSYGQLVESAGVGPLPGFLRGPRAASSFCANDLSSLGGRQSDRIKPSPPRVSEYAPTAPSSALGKFIDQLVPP